MNVIEVIDGGLLTTVQDLGRWGYQRYGVPVSGAMDTFALRAANLLVGNGEGDAALEITFAGATIRFLEDTVISVTGADLGATLGGQAAPAWAPILAPAGTALSFTETRYGVRAYLSIAGGIDVPPVLGSRATYTRSALGGLDGRRLSAGDILSNNWREPPDRIEGRSLLAHRLPQYGHSHELRVILGPQDDAFTREGIATFLSATYTVTPDADRTGYRLSGPTIQHRGSADIISDGNPLGAVQVAADGLPMVLLADRGTTGGYTKIATVISADIAQLAQAAPDDTVMFRAVTVADAHESLRAQETILKEIVNSKPVPFIRRRYHVRVDGAPVEVVGPLKEASVQSAVGSQHRTLHIAHDGGTRHFDIEILDATPN